jgi:phosphoribosylaminoimidazole-succinocarboxamide synthase
MVQSEKIISALPNCLKTISIPELGEKHQGKVRDFYVLPEKRIIITTDRQSAFDVVLGYIPYKGAVLNELAAFWFEKTKHIVANHVLAIPDPNVTVAYNLEPIPVEMVVRGFITGVTDTSLWGSYEKGERTIYGLEFPDGLRKNERLKDTVITPTTHAKAGAHDERLTRTKIFERKLVDKKLYEQMEAVAYELFKFGQGFCEKKGVILVDSKYEFGLLDGELILMDEIHTPDSSRFWLRDTYESRFEKGLEPEGYDKEFLRKWYVGHGYKGKGVPPEMPEQLAVDLASLYIKVYEKIRGEDFKIFEYPCEERIRDNVKNYI